MLFCPLLLSRIPCPIDFPIGGGGKISFLNSSLTMLFLIASLVGLILVPTYDWTTDLSTKDRELALLC